MTVSAKGRRGADASPIAVAQPAKPIAAEAASPPKGLKLSGENRKRAAAYKGTINHGDATFAKR